MTNFLKNKEVKIRKERNCWGCSLKFFPGTLMTNVVQVDGRDFSSTYWCEICNSYLDKNFQHFGYGITYGEFKGESDYEDYKKEYLCPKRNVLFEKHDVFHKIRQSRKVIEQNY